MDEPHRFLENFRSPTLLFGRDIGPPTQIAYYSYFPDPDDYRYQSRDALRSYRPPDIIPFSLTKAIRMPAFEIMHKYLDSLPQQGLEPIITSCETAGYADLSEANIITRRGVLTDLALGKKGEYEVSFVGRQLRILRARTSESQAGPESPNKLGPYYGHCFEKLCTHSKSIKPHGEFFSIVKRMIGKFNVIMAGEVDCSSVDSGVPRLVDYKELKTVWRPDVSSCAELLPEWYLQSYLLGVPRLAIGYRESGEVVSRIEEKAIDEVLQDAKRYKMFNPAGAFGRAHATFSWLQKCHRSLEKTSYANHKFKLRIEANYKASLTRIRPFGATV